MSEFSNMRDQQQNFRRQLLTTASAMSLLVCVAGEARADDTDRSVLWIELGGQLSRMDNGQAPVTPPDMTALQQDGFASPFTAQKPSAYSIEWDGKLSFQPEDSNWIFSASVRYGRSNNNGLLHREKANPAVIINLPQYPTLHHYKYPTQNINLIDVAASNSETHAILDFQAGKDVGLGLFGGNGSSTVSLGVRIAQFHGNSNAVMHVTPDIRFRTTPISSLAEFFHYIRSSPAPFHHYAVTAQNKRNFEGIGPSLSWNASAPLMGHADAGVLGLDWGVNVAALFGRQKVNGSQQTKIDTISHTYSGVPNHFSTRNTPHIRTRSVVVPNVGGFAGLSFRIANFKVSAGYRADFFFGAMDGGVDTRKTYDRNFYGPFASVSVGIGG